MATLREAWRRLQAVFRKRALDREFDEELAAHIELATHDHLRRGRSLAEARRRALIELGGVAAAREQHRDARGLPLVDALVQDLRYAVRTLRRTPGVTAVAVLSLALGIGANTAIFTLIESTLLRHIPVWHAEGLRLLSWRNRAHGWVAPSIGSASPGLGLMYEQRETPDGGLVHTSFSPPIYREFLRDNRVFQSLFGFKEIDRVTAVFGGSAEVISAFLVSGDFYRGVEVTPVIGRPIRPENDALSGENRVALISYDYWIRRFGRSPSVIGKTITLNEVPVTIIGVNPEYFTGIEPGVTFDVWAPLSLAYAMTGRPLLENPNSFTIPMMGRLKPGISDSQAQAEMDAIFQARLDADYPGIPVGKRPWFLLQPGARGLDYLTEHYEQPLLALLALAGLVLLIACANVANLLLAKSAVRQREVSLRLALGAGRWRVVRQLLTEGLLLASIAGAAGLIIGYGTRNGIPALLARPWRPSPFDTAFDFKVLLVSIAMTFLTGLLFSLAPIWQSRRVEVNESLKDGSRGTASLSKLRIGRLLVSGEIALSVVVLSGTVLCVKTFTNLRRMPLGMKPQGVVLFELEPPRLRYSAGQLGTLLAKVQGSLETIPGVQSATFSGDHAGAWVGPGSRHAELTYSSYARSFGVGSRFFKTLGIPILYGRAIDERDRQDGIKAAVVNQEFGRRFFHDENSLGRTFTGFNPVPGQTTGTLDHYRIVGVCADWRAGQVSLRDPVPAAFYPALLPEPPAGRQDFEVKIADRSAAAVRQVVQQMRRAVRSIDPDLPLLDLRTQVQEIDDQLSQERLLASLALVFGGLALVLAAIGIYGVIAYGVARKTNEIGIRVALGARPRRIAWMVLRETLWLAAAGVAIGTPAILAFGSILDHVLAPPYRTGFAYGTKANDPRIAGIAVLALSVVSFFAGYPPARRASRCDATVALRHE